MHIQVDQQAGQQGQALTAAQVQTLLRTSEKTVHKIHTAL